MELLITKRDGTKEPFNADMINRSIERAAFGIIDPIAKVTQIATDTHVTLYNGITSEELDQATINAAVQNIKEDPDYDKIAVRLLLKTVYKHVLGDYGLNPEQLQNTHREKFAAHIKKGVEDKILDPRMVEKYDLGRLANFLDVHRDELFVYAGFLVYWIGIR
jgi:ribonucleoside-diphosphate reductase alpha chain